MRAFLQTYVSYMKAAVISMSCATVVFFLASGVHRTIGTRGIPKAEKGNLLLVIAAVVSYEILSRIIAGNTSVDSSMVRLTKQISSFYAVRHRFVGNEPDVTVVTMFFDLKGSTQWTRRVAEGDFDSVSAFIYDLREWGLTQATKSPQGRPNLIKFMGDGFMFVWEVQNDSMTDSTNRVAGLAYSLLHKYSSLVNEEKHKRKFPAGVPKEIGISVDVGPAIRLTFENGFEDYLGSPLNNVVKMRNLARPTGGFVMQKKVWNILDEDLRKKFPKESVMKLEDILIPVRVMVEVEH